MVIQTITNHQKIINFIIILSLFAVNYLIQAYGIDKHVEVGADEGVQLYAAKLITQGYIPYKDFAFPSHLPFLPYVNAFLLLITHFNMTPYHLIYIAWVFSAVFPLFYTLLSLTKSRVAAVSSILLFSTYTDLVVFDSHGFAVRQASLVFFACFVYFAYCKKQYIFSQLALALFSWCLITNFLISFIFIVVFAVYDFFISKYTLSLIFKNVKKQYLIFFILSGLYYSIILIIPHSIPVLLSSQKYRIPDSIRVISFLLELQLNWPIFIFGFLGLYIIRKEHINIFILSGITFLVAFLIGNTFQMHYLIVTSVPLSITGGYFIQKILSCFDGTGKIIFISCVCFAMYLTVFRVLYFYLIQYNTPHFFETIRALKKSPEPIFTFQPIYALYANKNIVFFYNTADMRIFAISRSNLSYSQYDSIIKKSKTVILENTTYDELLPKAIKKQITQQFRLTFQNKESKIYERR